MSFFSAAKYRIDTLKMKLKGAQVKGCVYISGSVDLDKGGKLNLGDGVILRKGSKLKIRGGYPQYW